MVGLLHFILLFCWRSDAQDVSIRLVPAVTGVVSPTDIQHAGDGTNRLFIVEQRGTIQVFKDGALLTRPFLDIRTRTRGGGERGLLGLAFPPGFRTSGRFYVNYTNIAGHTVIAMYRVSGDPDVAEFASETILTTINQPFSNHNGGQLLFGPDGFLYIGMGDGGSGGDPQNHGQNPQSLLGKMLRVDVESEPGSVRIPADNPFAGSAATRAEIWALGLRNPWRFSFDRATGDLWIADVGQNIWEEINHQPASSRGGENYGWNTMEGAHCFQRTTCNTQGLVLPVAEFSHQGGNCSVTGGYVYRGPSFPSLRGVYIYGDYCSGIIWGVRREGNQWVNRQLLSSRMLITTFGEDEAGEVYVADGGGGIVYRVEGSRAPVLTGIAPGSAATLLVSGLLEEGTLEAEGLPLPLELNGVSVLVNGAPAPLHALIRRSGFEQINFQAPFELAETATAMIEARRNADVAGPVDVQVFRHLPAIVAAPAQPVRRGDVAMLYATGLGPVRNAPPTGSAAPFAPLAVIDEPLSVTIGDIAVEVLFGGLAPGLAGIYQLYLLIPDTAPAGTVDLTVTAGGVSSEPVRIKLE